MLNDDKKWVIYANKYFLLSITGALSGLISFISLSIGKGWMLTSRVIEFAILGLFITLGIGVGERITKRDNRKNEIVGCALGGFIGGIIGWGTNGILAYLFSIMGFSFQRGIGNLGNSSILGCSIGLCIGFVKIFYIKGSYFARYCLYAIAGFLGGPLLHTLVVSGIIPFGRVHHAIFWWGVWLFALLGALIGISIGIVEEFGEQKTNKKKDMI